MNPIPKSKQLAYKKKRKDIPKGCETEAPVQSFCDEYLEMKGIKFLRIPDRLWFWIRTKCPVWLAKECSKFMAGWCDNMAFIPLTDKYLLACPIENKSRTGKSRGKQKKYSKILNYQYATSPEDIIKIVERFIKDVEKIKKICNEKNVTQ